MWSLYCMLFLWRVIDNNVYCIPILEWWTPRLYPHLANNAVITCGEQHVSCISRTTDHSNHESVNAFIIYGSDVDIELKSLPWNNRLAKWALLHEESPLNNYRLMQNQILNSLFDITSTFDRNSSFPLTTLHLESLDYLMSDRYMINVAEKNIIKIRDGLAPIVYVQSNCNVPSDRDRYVKELNKYVDIDSYGQCVHNKDFPNKLLDSSDNYDCEEFIRFISRYKFMLTFENALCNDYISEKLWRSLHIGVVPIYRGSHTIQDWLPSNKSAIIVTDELELNPKKLANIIKQIDNNDRLYDNYREWKSEQIYVTNRHLYDALENRKWSVNDENSIDFIRGYECYICETLYSTQQNLNALEGCPKPIPSLGLRVSQLNVTDDWLYWDYEWNQTTNNDINLIEKHYRQEL